MDGVLKNRSLYDLKADELLKETVEFSFEQHSNSIFLGEIRQSKENSEAAEKLGLPEWQDDSYSARLLHSSEEMCRAAQPTTSCIADKPEEFKKFEKDEDVFFTGLYHNQEPKGYARGNLFSTENGGTLYWFDTVKLPSVPEHSHYEKYSDLHRAALLSHSEIGSLLEADHVWGAEHYLELPNLMYSSNDDVFVSDLYPAIKPVKIDIGEVETESKIENNPSEYPHLIYQMP